MIIKNPNEALSQYALDHLSYDPETGFFTWKVLPSNARSIKVGGRAGYARPSGYRFIELRGQPIGEHRLAWFFIHGKWPSVYVDHRDGDTSNNAISNLREATHAQNMHNRRSHKGYHWHPATQKFRARIVVSKRPISLGLFETEEEARAAYLQAKLKYHGEFAPNYVKSVS